MESLDIYGYCFLQYLSINSYSKNIQIYLEHENGCKIYAGVSNFSSSHIDKVLADAHCSYEKEGWIAHFDFNGLESFYELSGNWNLRINAQIDNQNKLISSFRIRGGAFQSYSKSIPIKGIRNIACKTDRSGHFILEFLNRFATLKNIEVLNSEERKILISVRNKDFIPESLIVKSKIGEDYRYPLNDIESGFYSFIVPIGVRGKLKVVSKNLKKLDIFETNMGSNSSVDNHILVDNRGGIELLDYEKVSIDDIYISNNRIYISLVEGFNNFDNKFKLLSKINDYGLDFKCEKNKLYLNLNDLKKMGLEKLNFSILNKYDYDLQFKLSPLLEEKLPFDLIDNDICIRVTANLSVLNFQILSLKKSFNNSHFSLGLFDDKTSIGLNENTAFFQCLLGASATDAQLEIRNALKKMNPSLKVCWGIEDCLSITPKGDERVSVGTRPWRDAFLSSKIVCINHELPEWFVRRDKQIVLQTYHGHPFKLMGVPRWINQTQCKEVIERNLVLRSNWSHLLSPSALASDLYKQCFPLNYKLIELGAPRNDELFESRKLAQKALKNLGLNPKFKYILYAPTWRDYMATSPWESSIPDLINWDKLSASLPDDVVMLFRGHPSQSNNAKLKNWPLNIVNVTDYHNINELMAVSTLAIFDYSSARFDYLLLDKPQIIYAPDQDIYFDYVPSLFPFEESIDGPIVRNQDDLIDKILDILDINPKKINFQESKERYCSYSDGESAIRVARYLIETMNSHEFN